MQKTLFQPFKNALCSRSPAQNFLDLSIKNSLLVIQKYFVKRKLCPNFSRLVILSAKTLFLAIQKYLVPRNPCPNFSRLVIGPCKKLLFSGSPAHIFLAKKGLVIFSAKTFFQLFKSTLPCPNLSCEKRYVIWSVKKICDLVSQKLLFQSFISA
jgi:hypothetical protein